MTVLLSCGQRVAQTGLSASRASSGSSDPRSGASGAALSPSGGSGAVVDDPTRSSGVTGERRRPDTHPEVAGGLLMLAVIAVADRRRITPDLSCWKGAPDWVWRRSDVSRFAAAVM
jgi:hypothetical protein